MRNMTMIPWQNNILNSILTWNKAAPRLIVYTDGSIRPDRHRSGVAAIVQDTGGKILYWWARRVGSLTNNEAEYAAVIFALENLLPLRPLEVDVFTDSRLIVDQM
ncbi:MAG: reverse transcriptase-like protein, partial [Anaerolineales bacterium]|nr:reverse transcriptase-like protein [Anaerolineales bacterium]